MFRDFVDTVLGGLHQSIAADPSTVVLKDVNLFEATLQRKGSFWAKKPAAEDADDTAGGGGAVPAEALGVAEAEGADR